MRRIKFRGKKIDTGSWAHGYCVRYARKTYIVSVCPDIRMPLLKACAYLEIDPETLSQFTGLKDKNGKGVYYKAIYHLDDFTDEYIVEWDDESAGFYLYGIQSGERKNLNLILTGECIGNAFENPELLKTE